MKRRLPVYLPGTLNAVAGIAVVGLSLLAGSRLPLPEHVARASGIALVISGMSLVGWAAVHLRGAFMGEVEPVLDTLVNSGPYQYVRHPVYLGMSLALLGVALTLRSWPGMVALGAGFVPTVIYRARLEERALWARFGFVWTRYAARTGFMRPVAWRPSTQRKTVE